MAIGNVSVTLSLDNSEFTVKMGEATRKLRDFESKVDSVSVELNRSKKVMNRWSNSISQSITGLNSAISLLDRLGLSLSNMGSSFINANASIEKTTTLLRGLESGGDSVSSVSSSLEYLKQTAKNTPFELDAISASFTRMKLGGLDPAKGSLDALIDGIAAFGGGTQQLDRSSIAIQQMMGKNVVSMEEMRQQLGEAMPQAMQLMADGLGMSIGQLSATIETGTLESTSAVEAMLAQMQLQFGGSAAEMMGTWDGLVSQIRSEIQLLSTEIGDSGLWDEMKGALEETIEMIKGDAFRTFAYEVGEMASSMVDMFGVLLDNIDLVFIAAKGLGTYMAGSLLRGAATAIGAVISSMAALGASVKLSTGAVETAIVAQKRFNIELKTTQLNAIETKLAMDNLSSGSRKAFESMWKGKSKSLAEDVDGLSKTIGSAANKSKAFALSAKAMSKVLLGAVPIVGTFGVVALELADHFDLLGGSSEEAMDKMKKGITKVKPEDIAMIREEIDKTTRSIERQIAVQKGGEQISELPGVSSAYGPGQTAAAMKGTKETQDALKKQVEMGNEDLQSLVDILGKQMANKLSDDIQKQSQTVLSENSKAFKAEIDQLKVNNKALIDQNSGNESVLRDQLKSQIKSRSLAQIEANSAAQIEVINARMAEETKNAMAIEGITESQTQQIVKSISDRGKAEKNAVIANAYEQSGAIRTGSKVVENALSDSQKIYNSAQKSLTADIAKNQGILAGESIKYSQILGQLAAAEIKNKQATVGKVMRLQAESAALSSLADNLKLFKSTTESSAEATAKLKASLASQSVNPFLSVLESTKDLKAQIDAINASQANYVTQSGAVIDITKQQADAVAALTAQMNAQDAVNLSAKTEELKKQADAVLQSKMNEEELAEFRSSANEDLIKKTQRASFEMKGLAAAATDPAVKQAYIDNAKALDKYTDALKKTKSESKSLTDEMLDDWGDLSGNMEKVFTNAADGMADALTDFVMTGKLDLDSLADSILRGGINASIKAATSALFSGGESGLGGFLGGLFMEKGGVVGANGSQSLSQFAQGGVMSKVGSKTLNTYAQGGVAKANDPQLAIFGEGDQNEAFVPLPDGRRIPVSMDNQSGQQAAPNISVNVINQTGTDADAEQQGQARFDGERYILDVVMKAMNKPGNFRSAMKGGTRQ